MTDRMFVQGHDPWKGEPVDAADPDAVGWVMVAAVAGSVLGHVTVRPEAACSTPWPARRRGRNRARCGCRRGDRPWSVRLTGERAHDWLAPSRLRSWGLVSTGADLVP